MPSNQQVKKGITLEWIDPDYQGIGVTQWGQRGLFGTQDTAYLSVLPYPTVNSNEN